MEKVGYIGLGVMGGPMARNLASKYQVTVYDTDPARMDQIPKADKAESIREVAESADVVFLSLPDSETVREVVLGSEGLVLYLSKDNLVIDTSTTSPNVSKEIAKELDIKGIGFLDSPVSGGEK